MINKLRLLLLAAFVLAANFVLAQPGQPSSSSILLKMKKLNVLGSAMYIAAHPDDENTRLIGYLSKEMLVNTAYLAITRGDGGQNLIGPELREGLGLIRTQELLAARRVDGSHQFFTRANDFGYSKTAKETLRIWDKEKVLQDVVWNIRRFRPDVIILRFPPDARAGHGHHTSSAILAEEAYEIAGTGQYANQFAYVDSWQPKRVFLNSGRWWDKDIDSREGTVKVDAGAFNPYLGESYTEMAARSRSMHKSQGFGSMGSRGESFEYLTVVKGLPTTSAIFDGIDITWSRIGRPDITKEVNDLISKYNPAAPYASVEDLSYIYEMLKDVEDDFWRHQKMAEIEDIIIDCSGLYVAAWASDFAIVPGSKLPFAIELVNRSPLDCSISYYTLNGNIIEVDSTLGNNKRVMLLDTLNVDAQKPVSGPYWLEEEQTTGMYRVDDQKLIGLAENTPPFTVDVTLEVSGETIIRRIPLIYHWRDRVQGEMVRPLTVVPPVFLDLSNPVYIFNNSHSKNVAVDVVAGKDNFSGNVQLSVPEGWSVSPQNIEVDLNKKWQSETINFTVKPSSKTTSGKISAFVTTEGKQYSRSLKTIAYNHIPYQIMLPRASSRAENLLINNNAQTVGYIMGAGDEVPEALEQMGVKVWVMGEADISAQNLSQLDAVIFGIRAANTLSWLPAKKPILMEYMNNGGTFIMQYNTTRNINWQDFAPYQLTFTGRSSDSRVAEETAEITVLATGHVVMNYPNKITQKDFDGWVQERGLYFPSAWDARYTAVLSAHDEGEDAKDGGLLIADYGKGHFVYTGYSWFRELPAGVPGAYRLFANILSLGSDIKPAEATLEKKKKRKNNK